MVRVKICCISTVAEARLAMQYGAAALGLVGPMPSGPGVIANDLIKTIAEIVPPGISTFLLTSETTTGGIAEHYSKVATTTIQLVDSVPKAAFAAIRQLFPAVKLVQVIHVTGPQSVEEALEMTSVADALLLDSGNPNLPVKELGGTGRTHNWAFSRAIVDQSPVPVYLAGGLHAGNVAAALDAVNPFGLDLCSGVRTAGQLDEAKLAAFFKAVYG
ncbi:MAG: phosphoribosylanthranilate isomerase [Chitinophagaceae bacterium]|nr:phosphoribosylanthranilate isomerase [Chitinophagaceae bacterium]